MTDLCVCVWQRNPQGKRVRCIAIPACRKHPETYRRTLAVIWESEVKAGEQAGTGAGALTADSDGLYYHVMIPNVV
jgi:hypothetical protein